MHIMHAYTHIHSDNSGMFLLYLDSSYQRDQIPLYSGTSNVDFSRSHLFLSQYVLFHP